MKTNYITIKVGTLYDLTNRLLDCCSETELRCFSSNAYVASTLFTNNIIGNGVGTVTIKAVKNGTILAKYRITVKPNKEEKTPIKVYPVLVNRWNRVPNGFVPEDLVFLSKGIWHPFKEIAICKQVIDPINAMISKAKEDGVALSVTHGYRSIQDQRQLLKEAIKEKGSEQAMKYGAPPYYSEHHTGLALDVTGGFDEKGNRITPPREAHEWMAENCYRFGFMIKNLRGKEHITGTAFEPWHIRYIGDLAAAEIIHSEKLTLDEYIMRGLTNE